MSDYNKIARLIDGGASVQEALRKIEQTFPTATTITEGGVTLATSAEVTTGTTSKVPPVSAMVAHEGVCKAWVNFNGTGTVAINDDYNVSSVTDDGPGDYTVNFVTAMANTNYVVIATSGGGTGAGANPIVHVDTASVAVGSFSIWVAVSTASPSDRDMISVVIFGDQ